MGPVQDTLEEVSQVVDGYMLLGEDILDRADRFTLVREEHVLPEADVPLDLGEAAAGTGPMPEAVGGSPLERTTQVQTPTGRKAGSGADDIGPVMGTSEGTANKQSGVIAVDEQGNDPTVDTGQRAVAKTEEKAAATSAATSGDERGGARRAEETGGSP